MEVARWYKAKFTMEWKNQKRWERKMGTEIFRARTEEHAHQRLDELFRIRLKDKLTGSAQYTLQYVRKRPDDVPFLRETVVVERSDEDPGVEGPGRPIFRFFGGGGGTPRR